MKKIRQINNWIIKEKSISEVPLNEDIFKCYAVFSPTGVFQEDNLTYEQAIKFCRENLDWVKK